MMRKVLSLSTGRAHPLLRLIDTVTKPKCNAIFKVMAHHLRNMAIDHPFDSVSSCLLPFVLISTVAYKRLSMMPKTSAVAAAKTSLKISMCLALEIQENWGDKHRIERIIQNALLKLPVGNKHMICMPLYAYKHLFGLKVSVIQDLSKSQASRVARQLSHLFVDDNQPIKTVYSQIDEMFCHQVKKSCPPLKVTLLNRGSRPYPYSTCVTYDFPSLSMFNKPSPEHPKNHKIGNCVTKHAVWMVSEMVQGAVSSDRKAMSLKQTQKIVTDWTIAKFLTQFKSSPEYRQVEMAYHRTQSILSKTLKALKKDPTNRSLYFKLGDIYALKNSPKANVYYAYALKLVESKLIGV